MTLTVKSLAALVMKKPVVTGIANESSVPTVQVML